MAEQPGLRPTGDRIRETLFNWLTPVIAGSRCLDCFAGSGALGLEAASRGAAEVVMLERSVQVADTLRANAELLSRDAAEAAAPGIRVIQNDALAWLATATPQPFGICFLDPPFAAGLLGDALGLLARRDWLAPGALVYLETARSAGMAPLPAGWTLIRDKQAGGVRFGLVEVTPGT